MMGLLVLAAFAFYLLVALVFVSIAVRMARRRGISGWKWGLPVGLVMYFLVFQDHLPSVALHAGQCTFGDAGFRVYTTIDQWRQENPGVWETLSPNALPEDHLVDSSRSARNTEDRHYRLPDGTELEAHFKGGKIVTTRLRNPGGAKGFWLNQRFIMLYEETRGWFHVYRWEEQLIDTKTDEVIARYVDYRSIVRLPAFANLALSRKACPRPAGDENWVVAGDSFNTFSSKIHKGAKQ